MRLSSLKKITTAKKKALICGYYGHYNLGDEAILAGMLKLLQQDDFSITVLSANPQDTQVRHGVKAVQSGGRKFLPICIFTMLQNPYFILGGGDLLRDSVDYPVATIWLRYLQIALQLHRRTFVLGISVGEIWKPETKKLIPEVLNKVDFLSVRDKDSKTKLEKLGVSNKIHLISDLALQALPNICAQAVPSTNKPIQIGVSIRPFKGRGLSTDQRVYPKFQQELAKLVDFLATEYKAVVHFLPFQTYENNYHTDDDYLSILNLLNYSQSSEKFVVHRYFKSVHEANHLISQLDLMIGMRLHALILASGLGIPVIAAAYDPKVHSFMHEIGQSKYSISLEDFEYNRLKPEIAAILKEPFVARQKIEQGVNQYRQSLMVAQASLKQTIVKNEQNYQIRNDNNSIRNSNSHNEVLINNK